MLTMIIFSAWFLSSSPITINDNSLVDVIHTINLHVNQAKG